MTAFLAIIQLTCRGAFRSNFFRGTIFCFLAATILMPFFIKSDGTAVSLIKLTLEYSLTAAVALLCISAVWMGASEITADMEDMRLQMIAVKPVSRPIIYLGKFTGIVVLHLLLLLVASAIIYGLTLYRVAFTDFAPGEKEQLYTEILTARRIFRSDPVEKDIDAAVEAEIRKHLEIARMQGKELPEDWETVRTKTGEFDEAEIRRRLKDRMRLEAAAIQPGDIKIWNFSGLPEDLDGPIRIRYNAFTENSKSDQVTTHGVWGCKYYFTAPGDPSKKIDLPVFFVPKNMTMEVITVQTTEFEIASKHTPEAANYICSRGFRLNNRDLEILPAPFPKEDTLMVKDGKATLFYQSLDKKNRTLYFSGGGPELLVPITGFFSNYCRTIFVLALLIIAFAAMGLAFSACLSFATGIFLTLAYVIWGVCVRFVLHLFTNTAVAPHNTLEYISYYTGKYIDLILFAPGKFSVQEKLSSGEVVEFSYIASVFLIELLVKILPIFALGLWIYSKRELALAGKER